MANDIKQKIVFSLQAPDAQSVTLFGDFSEWEASPVALKKAKAGLWKATVSLAPGRYEYRFKVDEQWADDPAATERVENAFGTANCVCTVQ